PRSAQESDLRKRSRLRRVTTGSHALTCGTSVGPRGASDVEGAGSVAAAAPDGADAADVTSVTSVASGAGGTASTTAATAATVHDGTVWSPSLEPSSMKKRHTFSILLRIHGHSV